MIPMIITANEIAKKYSYLRSEYQRINQIILEYQTGKRKLEYGYAEYLLLDNERKLLSEYITLLTKQTKLCKGE